MTREKALKATIRQRMAETGVPYNVARRAVFQEVAEAAPVPPRSARHIRLPSRRRRRPQDRRLLARNRLRQPPAGTDTSHRARRTVLLSR